MQNQETAAQEEMDNQWLRIRHIEKDNIKLQNLLDLCEIQTFEDGQYVLPIREVVLNLINMNIGHRNIVPAIQVVIDKLTNSKLARMPSYGTINKIVYEAKCLVLLQAGKAMLRDREGKAPSNILLEDATSKKRRTYNAVVIGTSEGLKTINLPTLVTEDSETLVNITKAAFDEVSCVLAKLEGKTAIDVSTELYRTIKGTMSDKCSVMKSFNKLISKEISNACNGEAIKLRNHYCFLHAVINMGDDACANGLVDLDKCSLPPNALNDLHAKSSSTTYASILLAARMLHHLGSEKYSRSDMFEAFIGVADSEESEKNEEKPLKSRKMTQVLAKKSYFEQEVGNPAHITFHYGTALWFHKKDITDFIDLHRADNSITEPMKTLESLLLSKVPLAGARALSIIKCCLTGPFQYAFDKVCQNVYCQNECSICNRITSSNARIFS